MAPADHRHRRVSHRRAGDDGGRAPQPPLEPSPDRHQVPGPPSIRKPPAATARASIDTPGRRLAQLCRPSRSRTSSPGTTSATAITKPGEIGVTNVARSSAPGASSAPTRVAASPGERKSGALAGRSGSLRQQAGLRLPAIAPKQACRPVPPEDPTVDHAVRLASGDKEGACVRGQHTSRGIKAGPRIGPRADRLRVPADAEKQGRQPDQRWYPEPDDAASLAAGEYGELAGERKALAFVRRRYQSWSGRDARDRSNPVVTPRPADASAIVGGAVVSAL